MRVGLDFRPAMRPRTGIGRYVAGLAGALAGRCDLRLFGVHFRGNLPERRRAPPGAGLVAWPLPSRLVDLAAALGLPGADGILGGCDLFHHTDYVMAPVGSRTREVFTLHDLAFQHDPGYHTARAAAALARVVRRALDRCAAILVPSEATARDCEARLGIARDRLFETPLGVDAALFDLVARPAPRPYLLSVGTLEPRKNHLRLLHAFRRVRTDAELLVAGRPGWSCDATLAAAAEDPRVRLLGHVDEAGVRDLYAGALAVVYPSLLEGFGLPVIEAMATGRPLITSDRDPMRALAGDAALLVDPESEEALEEAMRRVLDDAALRATLAERGRARARPFTWERCAEATLRAYAAVLA